MSLTGLTYLVILRIEMHFQDIPIVGKISGEVSIFLPTLSDS